MLVVLFSLIIPPAAFFTPGRWPTLYLCVSLAPAHPLIEEDLIDKPTRLHPVDVNVFRLDPPKAPPSQAGPGGGDAGQAGGGPQPGPCTAVHECVLCGCVCSLCVFIVLVGFWYMCVDTVCVHGC